MRGDLIKGLLDLKLKIGVMEKEIGLPKNNLSGILNGSRSFPEKWVKKIEDYIRLKAEPPIEKFTMEEIEKKLHNPAFLSTFLLRHPNPEAVRVACLHYLGDEYQKLDAFLVVDGKTTIGDLIDGYKAMRYRKPTPTKSIPYLTPDPPVNPYEVYKDEILRTTYSGDLQKIMKEVNASDELGAANKAKLRLIADDHRNSFTN